MCKAPLRAIPRHSGQKPLHGAYPRGADKEKTQSYYGRQGPKGGDEGPGQDKSTGYELGLPQGPYLRLGGA